MSPTRPNEAHPDQQTSISRSVDLDLEERSVLEARLAAVDAEIEALRRKKEALELERSRREREAEDPPTWKTQTEALNASRMQMEADRLWENLRRGADTMSDKEMELYREKAERLDQMVERTRQQAKARYQELQEKKKAYAEFLGDYRIVVADVDAQIAAAETRRLDIADRLRAMGHR